MNGFDDIRHALIVFTFGMPRIIGVFAMLPIFSKQILPGMVRNSVAASLVLFIFPVIADGASTEELTIMTGLGIALKETFIGILIGFGAAAVFWVMESVGFFIDNQRGATMASSMDPLTGSQTSPLGILLTQTVTVIFFVGGGFLMLLGAIYASYRMWPVFSFFPNLNAEAIPYFLSLLDWIIAFTILLAAPVIIAMFMTEFALGLVSRFAPQLNVFFLAMPVKSAVGILILVIYAGLLMSFFKDELQKLSEHFSMLRVLFG
ncbi:MAG: EscT/YscT/HrcT family type III secretion system export apparatus protein [Sulfitobacter sp.]|nr:EscT/YscT/HrcT family type III secretion system export apparatus protein [Sulfitobacter sp.]